MIELKLDELAQRLKNKGINNKIVTQVIEELIQGLCLEVKPSGSFIIDGGENLKIQILNLHIKKPEKGDTLSTAYFEIEIDGFDSKKIRSVTIPKLDYSSNEALSISLEVFPFSIPSINYGKDKKLKDGKN